MIFGKTYRPEDDDLDTGEQATPLPSFPLKKLKKNKKLSKKQLLDALEEHNDGYIYEDRSDHSMDD